MRRLLQVFLTLLPFAGMLGGAFFTNRGEPVVLGLPLLYFWIALWVVLTAPIMALVYALEAKSSRKGR